MVREPSVREQVILDMIGMIVVIIDRDHSIELINKKGCQLLECTPEQVVGKDWFDLFIPLRMRDDFRRGFDETFARGSFTEVFEHTIQTIHGREIEVLWHNALVRDENGAVIAVVCSGEDVTESRKLQRRQRLINERLGDVVLLYDEEGDITDVSASVTHILGYAPDDLKGKNIISFVHSDDVAKVKKRHQDLLAWPARVVRSEHRVCNKKGEWLWVEGEARNLLTEPDLGSILCNFRDISDRIAAKKALEASEAKYRDLVNSMAEAVVQIDMQANILFVNQSFCKLTSYTEEEVLGQNGIQLFVSEDELSRVQSELTESETGSAEQYEIQIKKKTGHYVWVSVNATPINGEDGQMGGILATLTDITQRKNATQQLEAMNKEMTDFFYKSSHDLKGPLSSVRGLLELAKEDVEDSTAAKYFEMMAAAIDKLSNTVQQVLQTIKVRDNITEPGYIDFSHIINDVLHNISHMPGIEDVRIQTDIKNAKPFYYDINVTYSVLQNMVENAVKYRNKTNPESWLRLTVEDHKKGVRIIAEDNGIGMNKQVQSRIFDMFYRAHADSQGTGLGLYIVRKGLEKLGGTIEVESEEGKGSRFIIYMPAMKVAKDEKEFITSGRNE